MGMGVNMTIWDILLHLFAGIGSGVVIMFVWYLFKKDDGEG